MVYDRHVRKVMLTNQQKKYSLNYETIEVAEEAATQAQAHAEQPSATAAAEWCPTEAAEVIVAVDAGSGSMARGEEEQQEEEEEGWAQCGSCQKWRKLKRGSCDWPDEFKCGMNSWDAYNKCNVAEEISALQ
jgi:hypothetical protein